MALELECVSESPARLSSGDRWALSQLLTCQVGTEAPEFASLTSPQRVLLVQGRDLENLRPQGIRAWSSREEATGAQDLGATKVTAQSSVLVTSSRGRLEKT